MDNIKIIRTDINVSKIVKQLEQYSDDWGIQKTMENTEQVGGDTIVRAGVLQLVMGGITKPDEYVGDTEICIRTPAYYRHTEIIGFMKRHFKEFKRAGFLALPPGGITGKHIDFGKYYLDKDRYHLSIQGRYEYNVDDETIIVEPGTLFWFDNKLEHSAKNIGDNDRIVLVWDVPHSKDNP